MRIKQLKLITRGLMWNFISNFSCFFFYKFVTFYVSYRKKVIWIEGKRELGYRNRIEWLLRWRLSDCKRDNVLSCWSIPRQRFSRYLKKKLRIAIRTIFFSFPYPSLFRLNFNIINKTQARICQDLYYMKESWCFGSCISVLRIKGKFIKKHGSIPYQLTLVKRVLLGGI